MKKIFCFIFAVLISSLAFTSCLAEDAYGLYTSVVDSIKDVHAVEGSFEVKLNITAGGASMGYTLDGNMQFIEHSETDMDMAVNMKVDLGALAAGSDLEMSLYYIDGWQYTNSAGTKTKEEMPLKDLMDKFGSDSAEKINPEALVFDRSLIVASETTKVDGGKKIYFELDGNKIYTSLMKLYEENVDTTQNDLSGMLDGLLGENTEVRIGNLQYTVLVDKNNVVYGASVVCAVEAGEDYKVEIQFNLNDIAFDGFTEIEAPDDLDTYSDRNDWSSSFDDYNFGDDSDNSYDDQDFSDTFDDMFF